MPELPPPVKVSPVIKLFRYVFLFSGVLYGNLKLHALRAYENSRTEIKAQRRLEHEARLIEEKRLAAERDFAQIVEVFKPPPKIEGLPPTISGGIYDAPLPTVVERTDEHPVEFGLDGKSDMSFEHPILGGGKVAEEPMDNKYVVEKEFPVLPPEGELSRDVPRPCDN